MAMGSSQEKLKTKQGNINSVKIIKIKKQYNDLIMFIILFTNAYYY